MFDFSDVTSVPELKKRYRMLAKEHHPDMGGSKEAMQALNAAYECRLSELAGGTQTSSSFYTPPPDWDVEGADKALEEATQLSERSRAPKKFWAAKLQQTGEVIAYGRGTYEVRDELKNIGFWWDPERRLWRFVRNTNSFYTMKV